MFGNLSFTRSTRSSTSAQSEPTPLHQATNPRTTNTTTSTTTTASQQTTPAQTQSSNTSYSSRRSRGRSYNTFASEQDSTSTTQRTSSGGAPIRSSSTIENSSSLNNPRNYSDVSLLSQSMRSNRSSQLTNSLRMRTIDLASSTEESREENQSLLHTATEGAEEMEEQEVLIPSSRNDTEGNEGIRGTFPEGEPQQTEASDNNSSDEEMGRTPSSTADDTFTTPEDTEPGADDLQESINSLTNRLRILFTCLTFPILPLGTILTLFLLSTLYAAQVTERHHTCSHPLKLYSVWSAFLFLYAPQHKNVKQWLFGYSRERDGPIRPRSVRTYDQCFHLLCLWYVYCGMLLVQDCEDDIIPVTPEDAVDAAAMVGEGGGDIANDVMMSSCQDTCPDLYLATSRFVFTLKVFAIVLIMPLVCLPFVYLWIIRRVNSEELLARFAREEAEDENAGVLAKEIMESLQEVVLIPVEQGGSSRWKRSVKNEGNNDGNKNMVRVAFRYNSKEADEGDVEEQGPKEKDGRIRQWLRKKSDEEELLSSRTSRICEWENVKECCICMSEFETVSELPPITRTDDNGLTISTGDGAVPSEEDVIIQTKCGHLFHKECISGWIGGNIGSDSQSSRRNGRALRRTCPLCREDLTPETTSANENSTSIA